MSIPKPNASESGAAGSTNSISQISGDSLDPNSIRTPRVHPSRGQIRSCIEFSPVVVPVPSSRGPDGSPIRANFLYPERDDVQTPIQYPGTGRTSRSSSIQEISAAHSLSSGGAGCIGESSSRRTSLSHLNSSSRTSVINPTFLDINHLIDINQMNFGELDYGDEDHSLSHSASSDASGGMDHDSLEDLHRQQDAEFQDLLEQFQDQQQELEQRIPRTSHSQTSLSLSSVVSNEDTSESSCGTLSEIFESLSRFSEHCLASVEALNSPVYLNTSSFTTTPTGPQDNFEFHFDYEAPHMSTGHSTAGQRDPTTDRDSRGEGSSGFLGINEARHRRTEFFRSMLERQAPKEEEFQSRQSGGTGGQTGQRTCEGLGESSGAGGGATAASAGNSGERSSKNILEDIGLELEIFTAGLEFGNIMDLPAVPSTSRGVATGERGSSGGEASGENSIVAALTVLQEAAPLVSALDWQERCVELELALQRFGEQATKARLMLRAKVRKFYLFHKNFFIAFFFTKNKTTPRYNFSSFKMHLILLLLVGNKNIYIYGSEKDCTRSEKLLQLAKKDRKIKIDFRLF
jgi:hypothetical protein